MKYDFSGWATKNDILCSDGRTIRRNAFADNDGQTVPLVWNHQHNDPSNILGHAALENRPEGVYAYCKFNDTESGQTAKQLVQHGDVAALSIYANKLKQTNGNVTHGCIREVSLVLSGANSGAKIDTWMAHGDGIGDEGVIYTGLPLELSHGESEENEVDEQEIAEILSTLDENQVMAVNALIDNIVNQGGGMPEEGMEEEGYEQDMQHADNVGEVLETLDEDQVNAVNAHIYNVLQAYGVDVDDIEDVDYNDEEGDYDDEYEFEDEEGDEDYDMKHNVFDADEGTNDVLMHNAMNDIITDAKQFGSLKESFLAHADEYGIEQIDWLFPEAHQLNNVPEFIKRETGWVSKVMSGVHHSAFSRIKSRWADITEDEARAKGYMKGNRKKEEIFTLLKRATGPTTIYKKQKLDRDDIIDITDFDVVSWLKGEMRMMLDEELARAFLIGDGRQSDSDDKIKEDCIRPIWKDDDLFTIKKQVELPANATADQRGKAIIRAAIKSRKDYKGSGEPVLFTTEDLLTELLLIEDANGRDIYDSEQKLATKMRVKSIVTVPVMENQIRTDAQGHNHKLLGLIVNLSDYNVGADKGGAINMFDDFDIDYNQQKYLIETRCSGALIKPYSAIALEEKVD